MVGKQATLQEIRLPMSDVMSSAVLLSMLSGTPVTTHLPLPASSKLVGWLVGNLIVGVGEGGG